MSRVFFDRELDTVATFWRIYRRDGVAHAFTTHDRDIWLEGMLHLAAPGMLPSAIRRTADLADDGAEIAGALSHDAIREADLAAGRFDGARVTVGALVWSNGDAMVLYRGTVAGVERDGAGFVARLRSAKAALEVDPVPRTSPTCRARFCDRGCTLPASAYTSRAAVIGVDPDSGTIELDDAVGEAHVDGELRWIDGPLAGRRFGILSGIGSSITLDGPVDGKIAPGTRVLLREGCDHTIATCAGRFGNEANFRGEPFIPGNDLLARYPQPR